MPRYGELYPNTEPYHYSADSMVRHNVILDCKICNEPTTWFDSDLKEYICSTECRDKLWELAMESFVQTWETNNQKEEPQSCAS